MSRSYRHNPFTGFTTAKSEKTDKRIANRRYRKALKEKLRGLDPSDDEEDFLPPKMEEISSGGWYFEKDGKMRFDPKEYPKLLRK